MKTKYGNINEEIDRMKSLFTEERLYGNLVEQHDIDGENPEEDEDTGDEVALKVGDKGKDVEELQAKVGADTDGVFGPKTEKAVKEKQKELGEKETGVAGKTFLGKIGAKIGAGIKKVAGKVAGAIKGDGKDRGGAVSSDDSEELDITNLDKKVSRNIKSDRKDVAAEIKDTAKDSKRVCKQTVRNIVKISGNEKNPITIEQYVNKAMGNSSDEEKKKNIDKFKSGFEGCLQDYEELYKPSMAHIVDKNGIDFTPPEKEEKDKEDKEDKEEKFTKVRGIKVKEDGRLIANIKQTGENEYRLVGKPKVPFLKPRTKNIYPNKVDEILAAIKKTGSIEKTSGGTRGSRDRFNFKVV